MSAFRPHPADHRFYGTFSVVAAAVVVTGFANTYGPKLLLGAPQVPGIVHVHAAVFTLWLAAFVLQAALVSRGRVQLHMRLGSFVVALAGIMLLVGLLTAISVARLGHRGIPGVEFPTPEGFLLLNVGSVLAFAGLVAAGWAFRRRPQVHKRLMLAATVGGLMPPGIARLPFVSGHEQAIAAVAVGFLLVGPVYDLATRRRVHPAYTALLVTLAIVPPVVLGLSTTGPWLAVAAWLTR